MPIDRSGSEAHSSGPECQILVLVITTGLRGLEHKNTPKAKKYLKNIYTPFKIRQEGAMEPVMILSCERVKPT